MAFFEAVFPECISINASGGPRFFTSKAYTTTGQRVTNRDATYPLQEYSISTPVRTGQDFEELRAFFYVVGGDADAFRFKDWTDYTATQGNSALTFVSDTNWQLCRIYTFGVRTFVRPIYKPRSGVTIWRNRTGVISQATASIDTSTGIADISGHESGDTYTWEGEFDVPVAFREPQAIWNVLGTPKMLTEWQSIELEEVRL